MSLSSTRYRVTSLAPDGPGLVVAGVTVDRGQAEWLTLDTVPLFLNGTAADRGSIVAWFSHAIAPMVEIVRDDALDGAIDEARFTGVERS